MPWITAGQEIVYSDEESVLEQLIDPNFNPQEKVFITSESEKTSTPAASVVLENTTWSSHAIEVTATNEEKSVVVFSQTHYPAWKAWVNDKPAEIYLANYAYQAVLLPPGINEVRLEYQDAHFWWGSLLSLSAIFVWICSFLWSPKRV